MRSSRSLVKRFGTSPNVCLGHGIVKARSTPAAVVASPPMTKHQEKNSLTDPPTTNRPVDAGEAEDRDITPQLTFSVEGPPVIDLRSELDTVALGAIVTAEQALALRPRLDDPTRLGNGSFHPRYSEWIVARSWGQQHPLSEYLYKERHLSLLSDERGYFDRKRVNQTLGPSGSKIWLVDGPLPTKGKVPLLAQLLEVSVDEVHVVVEEERKARSEYQAMVSSCRTMPYKLLTYDQIRAGVPCPGCGRPWVGPQEELDRDKAQWQVLHGECRAGSNGYSDAPLHCLRCCGVPALSPEQIASVRRVFKDALDRQERERQFAAKTSPEAKRHQQAETAAKRAKRIEKLESELARLRAEEAEDFPD